MDYGLAGRTVIVTGAARGQGAAEAEILAREGARVVGADILDDEGKALAERLTAVPGVRSVETVAPGRFRLLAEGDVRPQAAAAVVNAGGALTRLSVEDPSLDAIYNRYFQDQGVRDAA